VTDEAGNPGVRHIKCIADGRWLFLSSANLTESAFTVNMELGVLVCGGNLPLLAESQFQNLIDVGVVTAP
jgi:phosphatidylserine/phosphatidylglycerophosphate/cardiolipin synthase-like enzyme